MFHFSHFELYSELYNVVLSGRLCSLISLLRQCQHENIKMRVMKWFFFWYCLLLFHTVKCTLTELTTKSFSTLWKSMVFVYAHAREFYVLFVWEFLACALSANFQYCLEWQFIIQAVSPPLSSLFPLFIQCDRCLFPFPVWRHMAELPGFTSHGSSLHLGADCQ